MPSNATIESGHRRMSGTFHVPDGAGRDELTFKWDGAALNQNGDIILIEDELTSIVPLHIQGHLARAALMNQAGDPISRLIWVVREDKFERLWSFVEPWRRAVSNHLGIETPPCEYQNPEGERLMVSHDFK